MKKKIFIIISLLIFTLMFGFTDVKADDIIDESGGGEGTVAGRDPDGDLQFSKVGLKISIMNSSNSHRATAIILNSTSSGSEFSTSLIPKTKMPNYEIYWSTSVPTYVVDYLPSSWEDSNGNIVSMYDHLTKNNYENLLKLLNETKSDDTRVFPVLSPGDYILIEPMVNIDGYYGTAFELINAFTNSIDDDCHTAGEFCYEYTKLALGGNTNSVNGNGGILYETLYTINTVTGANVYVESDWAKTWNPSGNDYDKRNRCLKAKTCGRGIGVFKYEDIMPTNKVRIAYHPNGGIITESAEWSLNQYGFIARNGDPYIHIIYNDNRDSNKYDPWNANNASSFNLRRPGYVFAGWKIKTPNSYTGAETILDQDTNYPITTYTQYNDQTKNVSNTAVVDCHLYAQWVPSVQTGTVKINKKNSVTGTLISSSNATFEIYNGTNCTGTLHSTVTTSAGAVTISNLTPGTYSIKEVTVPSGYITPSEPCVVKNVSISAGTNSDINIQNTPDCAAKLASLGSSPTRTQLIDLYYDYPNFTNLLNFSNPSCSINTSCDEKNLSIDGCLSATISMNNFDENNLSCYDDALNDLAGKYIGFCKSSYLLVNKLGVNTFYSKAGQFLIRQKSSTIIQIYDQNLDPVEINASSIATGTSKNTCYLLSGKTATMETSPTTAIVYFGDGESELPSTSATQSTPKSTTSGLDKYVYTTTVNYNLKDVYLEKITGKLSYTKAENTTDAIKGLVSNFNSNSSGSILFEMNYDGKTYSSNSCKYSTIPEIIEYDSDPNGELELVFRSIQTTNPFPGSSGTGRNVGKNWCDGSNCENDNALINNIMENRNDSYNKKNAEPLYKIVLDSSTITQIREYNKTTPYDDYTINCSIEGNNTCEGFFEKFSAVITTASQIPQWLKNYETVGSCKQGNGDVNNNGIVDSVDVDFLRKYLAGGYKEIHIEESNSDVNGDCVVNAKDVAYIRRYLSGWYDNESNSPCELGNGDVNNDGIIDSVDVDFLRKHLAGGYEDIHIEESNSDVNGDCIINSKDVAQIRRYLEDWEGYELQN